MLTEFPASNHAREDIHEQSDIDEAVLEVDVGDIAHPDLIASTDLKRLEVIPPGLRTVSGVGRLTDTFDGIPTSSLLSSSGRRVYTQRCVLRLPTPS